MTEMNAKKGIGDKVLGWFIVREGEELEPDSPDVPETRPSAPSPRPSAPKMAPRAAADSPGFAGVYRAAGVDEAERERLTKVVTLVETLPSETTVEVKRAIVAASLEAFGVSIDRILVTGEGALAALDAHVEDGRARTREVLSAAEARIVALNAEIAEVRRQMDGAVAAQDERTHGVAAERSRLRAALDFFGTRPAGASAPRLVRLK